MSGKNPTQVANLHRLQSWIDGFRQQKQAAEQELIGQHVVCLGSNDDRMWNNQQQLQDASVDKYNLSKPVSNLLGSMDEPFPCVMNTEDDTDDRKLADTIKLLNSSKVETFDFLQLLEQEPVDGNKEAAVKPFNLDTKPAASINNVQSGPFDGHAATPAAPENDGNGIMHQRRPRNKNRTRDEALVAFLESEPGLRDVILKQGGATYKQAGNKFYRRTVSQYQQRYSDAPSFGKRKKDVAREVLEILEAEGVRFLVEHGQGGWNIVEDRRWLIKEKIQEALKMTPAKRVKKATKAKDAKTEQQHK